MSKLKFDEAGKHFYENGIREVVLYVQDELQTQTHKYHAGVAWNGVTALTESPQGADANPLYADDMKYLNLIANETFNATIEAYSSPVDFDDCDGTAKLAGLIAKIGQQTRKRFCLAYKTRENNDEGNETDKWHFIYNCKAAPSSKDYGTVNDSPEAASLSWELTALPLGEADSLVNNVQYTNVCTAIVSYRDLSPTHKLKWTAFENEILGKDGSGSTNIDPHIMFPTDIYTLFEPIPAST